MTPRTLPAGSYFGRSTIVRPGGAVRVVVTEYAPGERLPRHSHERPYLCVALEGRYEEADGARTHEHGRGALVLNGVGSNPLSLLFCPSNSPIGEEKDTLRNCKPASEGGVGQFVVNVATEAYANLVSAASEELSYGESEFALTGLTPAPSVRVKPPRVLESPVCYECETMQVIRTNPGAPGGGNVVIGRIVHIYVRDDCVDARHRIDPDKTMLIGRMGGEVYCRTRERFEMPRGKAAMGMRAE